MRSPFAVRSAAFATALTLVINSMIINGSPAVAAPGAVGDVPVQATGSAAGLGHEVDAAATRAVKEPEGGGPPAPGGLPSDVDHPVPLPVEAPVAETAIHVDQTPKTAAELGLTRAPGKEISRDTTTQVFENADGSRTVRLHSGRRFDRAPDGRWVDLDETLVDHGHSWATKADSVVKRFAAKADAPTVAAVQLTRETSFGYAVAGAAPAVGRVSGSEIVYPDVRPGADLKLRALPGGIKEAVVLKSKDAPSDWAFPLRLEGLAASLEGGSVVLRGKAGSVVAVIPPGYMEDAKVDPHTGEGARSSAVTYELTGSGATTVLHVKADPAWLRDPTRVFPVELDPTVEGKNSNGSTFVQSPYNADHSGDIDFSVGTFNGGGNVSAAYLKFDNVSSQLAGNYVMGAKLWMYETWSYSCSPRPVYVHPVTAGWTLGGYKTYPGPAHGAELANASFAAGYSSSCSANGAWQGIDLGSAGRDLVHGWTHGAANNGLSVQASTTDTYGWKKFASANTVNAPYLDVTYTPYWATYEVGAMTQSVTSTSDGKMRVTVTNHGRDTWTPTNNYKLHYRLWDSNGNERSDVAWTVMPQNVVPGQSVTVDATVRSLPPGSYTLRWDMDLYGTTKFSWTGAPMSGQVAFTIPNQSPVIDSMSPPSNFTADTLTPTLAITGHDRDNWPNNGLAYLFKVCDADGTSNCFESGWTSASTYTVPAGKFKWGGAYTWFGSVGDWNTNCPFSAPSYLSARIPQPAITSHLARGTAADGALEPGVGNYTTSATDAMTTAIGPELSVARTYNSLDPRRSLAFGAGWASRYDTALAVDGDGTGNVVVTYPTGRQARFGRNADGGYGAPPGSGDTLVAVTGGGWTLRSAGPTTYSFDSAGKLTKISDQFGREQRLTYSSGKLTTATDAVSGRALTFTWTGGHITKVSTGPGVVLDWNYTYDGDKLTQVCDPTGACTIYEYGTAVHYPNVVLDGNPNSYWRLNSGGSSTAWNSAPITGPTTNGTYSSITYAPGPINGTSAAIFNGTTSHVRVPDNAIRDRTQLSVELWFKTTSTTGGVLFGTGNNQPGDATPSNGAMPVLYVGTDGKLYGHFWNGQVTGIVSASAVNNGTWHHVVLSGAQNTQTLYLDGVAVGTQSGAIGNWDPYTYIGMGPVMNNPWPAKPTDNWGHFAGQISDVALYHRPLGATVVADHFAAAATLPVLTKVTRPGGAVAASLVYEPVKDRVDTLTDANGGRWSLTRLHLFSPTENWARLVIPSQSTTDYTYNPSRGGRLVKVSLGGYAKTYGYDSGGFVNEIVDENGNAVSMVNDARGNVLSHRPCKASVYLCATAYRSYYHNAADPLDPRNNQVTEARDSRSSGPTDNRYMTTHTYNERGDVVTTVSPGSSAADRRTTTNTYTTGAESAVDGGTMPPGLLLTATKPGGGSTRYAYAANGDLRQVTDPAGLVTTAKYDGLGRAVEQVVVSDAVPGGAKTTFAYDGASRLTEQVEPAVTNVVTGASHQSRTKYSYNPSGTLASTAFDDVAGGDEARTTTYTYDAFNRVATVTDPMGGVTRNEYDTSGARTKLIDAGGTEYAYEYEMRRHLPITTTVKGFTGDGGVARDVVLESNAYDPGGRLASRTDAMGRTVLFEYRDDNKLYADYIKDFPDPKTGTVTAKVNLHYYYYWGELLRGVETWGGLGYQVLSRDPAGRIVDEYIVDQYWSVEEYRRVQRTFDVDDNVVAQVELSPKGAQERRTEFTYDKQGRELTRTLVDGSARHVTTTALDQRGLVLSTTDARGAVTAFSYDAVGRDTRMTLPQVSVESGGSAPATVNPTMSKGYNTFGEVTDLVDPNGARTVQALDRLGRPTAITEPAYTRPDTGVAVGGETRLAYDGMSRVLERTDASGAKTTFGYDQLGNQVRRTDPLLPGQSQAGVWTSAYDPLGELLSRTNPTGALRSFTYDQLGRPLTETTVERVPAPTRNLTTRYAYDDRGGLASVTTADNRVTKFLNDGLGQPMSVTDPVGKVSTFTYDGPGRVTSATDPLGNKVSYRFDAAGRPAGQTATNAAGATLRTLSIAYDAVGNPVSSTDGAGVTTTRSYDALGRLTAQTQPVASGQSITNSWGYDAAGHVTRATDGNGNRTIYTVNSRGLTESTVEPATAAHQALSNRTFTASYDAMGRLVTLAKPGGVVVTGSYDPLGSLVRQTGSGTSVTTGDRVFGRDLLGRLVSASAPGGTNTYAYDDRGNLVSASGPGGTSAFAFTGDGQVSSATTAAGAASYTYDAAGRLATAMDPLSGATGTYGYDDAGRLTNVGYGAGKGSRTLGYDALNRLTADTTKDPAGAVTASISYGYDDADRVTSKTTTGLAGAAANSYGYDQAGRLISWTNGPATTEYAWDGAGNRIRDGATTATYDERNRLVSRGETTHTYKARGTLATRTTGGVTTEVAFNAFDELVTDGATSYQYDGLGRLANRGVHTLSYSGAGQEIAADGVGRYTYLPGGAPLGVSQDGTAGLALTDRHTDLVGIVDPPTGALAASRAYDPFGQRTAAVGTQPALGFQHQYTDPDTGSVAMGARWYSPSTGAFQSRDAARLDPRDLLNANRYTYVAGDPLNYADPTGRTACLLAAPLGPQAVAACKAAEVVTKTAYNVSQGGSVSSSLGNALGVSELDIVTSLSPSSGPTGFGNVSSLGSAGAGLGGLGGGGNPSNGGGGNGGGNGGVKGGGSGSKTGGKGGGGGGKSTGPTRQQINAARVALNATTQHVRPNAVPTIAANLQTTLDEIYHQAAIDLGVLNGDPAGDDLFQPELSPGGGNPGQLIPEQGYIDDSCLTGGYLRWDGSRSNRLWTCVGADAYVWTPFREGVDDTEQGILPANAGIPAGASLVEGYYHFIVRQDGSLRAMEDESMWEIGGDMGHTSLGNRQGVNMAGTFEVDQHGVISLVNNFSGHYRPTNPPAGFRPLLDVTREAFHRHGWTFADEAWQYYPGPPGG